jgi:hypothetical protein
VSVLLEVAQPGLCCWQMRQDLFRHVFGVVPMSEAANPATAVVLKVIEVLEHAESLPVLLHERYGSMILAG